MTKSSKAINVSKPQTGTVYVTFDGDFSSAAANFISKELRYAPEASRAFLRRFRQQTIVDLDLPTLEIAETRAAMWQQASDKAGAGFYFGWK